MMHSHVTLLLCLLGLTSLSGIVNAEQETCSITEQELDPHLKEIQFDYNGETETFLAYVQPDVRTFYRDIEPPAKTAVTPMHEGFAGKFFNLSKDKMMLYWYARVCMGSLHECSSS